MKMNQEQLPDDDDEAAAVIVQRLKSQGVFDSMRRECLADIDTKPAFLNLSQRIERYVSTFLDRQEWRQDLNKNQLRERLRRNLTESNMMKYGVDHLVDGAVQAKRRTFMPDVEKAVKEMMGIEDDEIVDWPDAEELKSEPDVDNSQQDMDVDDDSRESSDIAIKSENFIPSFVELQHSSSQSSSSPPVQSKSIIQQLFEPIVRKDDEKTLTPTKISIQLNIGKQFNETIKEEPREMESVEEDQIATVDMDEDSSRPSSSNSISNIQLPSSPPPPRTTKLPTLTAIQEVESTLEEIPTAVVANAEPSIAIKLEKVTPQKKEIVEDVKMETKVEKEDVPPLEYLSDVSSVHTSDLSDFDGRLSPDSSDQGGESPKKESPAKIKDNQRSRKSKDGQPRKRKSQESQPQNADSRPSTSSSTGRRERKINPKYTSDDYTSIYNRGKGKQAIEEDISSDEDFDLEAESTASKSTPVQDELSNDGSASSSKMLDCTAIKVEVEDAVDQDQDDSTSKSQLKNVRRKTSRRQERYDASDLYKPRPMIGSSRRNRNANADQT